MAMGMRNCSITSSANSLPFLVDTVPQFECSITQVFSVTIILAVSYSSAVSKLQRPIPRFSFITLRLLPRRTKLMEPDFSLLARAFNRARALHRCDLTAWVSLRDRPPTPGLDFENHHPVQDEEDTRTAAFAVRVFPRHDVANCCRGLRGLARVFLFSLFPTLGPGGGRRGRIRCTNQNLP